MTQLSDNREDKPDFEKEAKEKYPTPYVCEGLIDITPAYRDGFRDGADHVWSTYVLPLKERVKELEARPNQNLAIINHLATIGGLEARIRELEKQNDIKDGTISDLLFENQK